MWHMTKSAVISILKKSLNFNDKKNFVQTARCFGGIVFKDIHESFKKDREIVLAAVQQHGMAVLYADQSLREDQEISCASNNQLSSIST